jgi:antitoxin FitA
MRTITINLSDDRMQQLVKLAHEAHIPPEDLLRARVEAWLNGQSHDFIRAAEYVLKKNEEFYSRLAMRTDPRN